MRTAITRMNAPDRGTIASRQRTLLRTVMLKDDRGASGRQASVAGRPMRPNRHRIGKAVRAVRRTPEDSRRDRR
jgi:hypothetical protein